MKNTFKKVFIGFMALPWQPAPLRSKELIKG